MNHQIYVMRNSSCLFFLLGLCWQLAAQAPVSQIEGYLELYHPGDTFSLYLGKGVARNVNNSQSRYNTIVGNQAGRDNTTGDGNTFVGAVAGRANTEGTANSYFGFNTGKSNTVGFGNAFFGYEAGLNSLSASGNAFFGTHAGSSARGSYNAFFGNSAGAGIRGDSCIALGAWSGPSYENGNVSQRLFVDVKRSSDPLIYGEFDHDLVRINGTLQLGAINYYSNSDDGLIRAPNDNGADLHLVANDAIVLEIGDYDQDSDKGFFEVWKESDQDKLLVLDENGDLDLKGTVGTISDVHRKEQIVAVNRQDILKRLMNIPISEWQYIGSTSRHIGPMAQDFHKAFGLGKSDTRIATIDADGVALVAIQAQQHLIEAQQTLINELIGRIEKLEESISK